MATVPLQASPSSTLFLEPKPSDSRRGRLTGIDSQLNSVSVSSSGLRIGGRGEARSSSSALENFIPTGLSKEKSRVRAKPLEWRGGRSWSSDGSTQREVIVRALDGGDFSGRENAKDRSLEKFRGEGSYQSFFKDQVLDNDGRNDLDVDYSTPDEGLNGVSVEVETFMQNKDLEEPFDAQGDAEERRTGFRSREWAQLDGEGRRQAPVSQRKEGGYNGNLDDVGQTSSREQGLLYTPNPVSESIPLAEDRNKSRIALRNAREDDHLYENRRSPPYELGAVEEYRGRPADDFDNRYDLRSNWKDEVSEIEDDERQDPVLRSSGRIRRERTSTTMSGREAEQEESARGVLYAKQVISLATAQSLGFVTQLWVDVDNPKFSLQSDVTTEDMKSDSPLSSIIVFLRVHLVFSFLCKLRVVALEVRPSLLFGDFCSFPMNSISKVGDVVLIQDDDNILEGLDLFNCSDLVGIDLFTEDGMNLGKVRDYNFSLEDGAVVSIEFDSFGVPLIPSKLVKTYSLTVDEVIETQQDGLLVRRGAEKRVRKLSKGFLSRSKKSSAGRQSPSRQQRKQAPDIQYLGQTTERVRGIAERDNYTPGHRTPRQQPKRGNIYSVGRRELVNESASRFESDRTTDVYPSSSFSSRSRDLSPEEFEDYQTVPVRYSPDISENEQTQGSDFGISSPEISVKGRVLPMPYRTSRRQVEND